MLGDAMSQNSDTPKHAPYTFGGLKEMLAKASPLRSGDCLAGVAAEDDRERVAAQMALAEVPLRRFLEEPLIAYEEDEVTRLIFDDHDSDAGAEEHEDGDEHADEDEHGADEDAHGADEDEHAADEDEHE